MEFKLVHDFWFKELTSADWYKKDPALDEDIKVRFKKLHDAAAAGELFSWRETAEGALSEVILLDQLSRNMHRDTPGAFAFDSLALVLAQSAVSKGQDQELPNQQRSFLYMPYMHSESLVVHDESAKLFSAEGFEGGLDYEMKHRKIIEQFGRYPHRNEILGRTSTPEEIEFLSGPGSSF